jgi:hypothetical protein
MSKTFDKLKVLDLFKTSKTILKEHRSWVGLAFTAIICIIMVAYGA